MIPERRDGIGEDIDPRELSGRGFLGIVGRESIGNGTCPVVGLHQQRQHHQFAGALHCNDSLFPLRCQLPNPREREELAVAHNQSPTAFNFYIYHHFHLLYINKVNDVFSITQKIIFNLLFHLPSVGQNFLRLIHSNFNNY